MASQKESRHAQGSSSCRRCSQLGHQCHKSHGEGLPCDKCCSNNRYCYYDTDMPEVSQMWNAPTNMTTVEEPLLLDDGYVLALFDEPRVYDRLDVTIGRSPSEADDEETEDSMFEEEKNKAFATSVADPILVKAKLRDGVLSEAKRCRRRYYDDRHCYRSRGPNEACDKCVATKTKCNPDLTGVVPFHRNARRVGSRLPPQQMLGGRPCRRDCGRKPTKQDMVSWKIYCYIPIRTLRRVVQMEILTGAMLEISARQELNKPQRIGGRRLVKITWTPRLRFLAWSFFVHISLIRQPVQ